MAKHVHNLLIKKYVNSGDYCCPRAKYLNEEPRWKCRTLVGRTIVFIFHFCYFSSGQQFMWNKFKTNLQLRPNMRPVTVSEYISPTHLSGNCITVNFYFNVIPLVTWLRKAIQTQKLKKSVKIKISFNTISSYIQWFFFFVYISIWCYDKSVGVRLHITHNFKHIFFCRISHFMGSYRIIFFLSLNKTKQKSNFWVLHELEIPYFSVWYLHNFFIYLHTYMYTTESTFQSHLKSWRPGFWHAGHCTQASTEAKV